MLIVIIGAFAWLGPARLVRGEALSLRTREYIQAMSRWAVTAAARSCGTSCRTPSER